MRTRLISFVLVIAAMGMLLWMCLSAEEGEQRLETNEMKPRLSQEKEIKNRTQNTLFPEIRLLQIESENLAGKRAAMLEIDGVRYTVHPGQKVVAQIIVEEINEGDVLLSVLDNRRRFLLEPASTMPHSQVSPISSPTEQLDALVSGLGFGSMGLVVNVQTQSVLGRNLGLEKGDRITKINGKPVSSPAEVRAVLAAYQMTDKLVFLGYRENQEMTWVFQAREKKK